MLIQDKDGDNKEGDDKEKAKEKAKEKKKKEKPVDQIEQHQVKFFQNQKKETWKFIYHWQFLA